MTSPLVERMRAHPYLSVGTIAFLLVLPLVLRSSRIFLLTLVFVYALLAFSAIIPIGYTGQLILAQGAFFGIGAYSYVKLAQAAVPSWIAIVIAVVLTAVVAYVLGWPSTRASGIYLGIITLAFNEMFVISLDLFGEFFGGSQGLSSPDLYVPEALLNVVPIDLIYYYLALVVFGGTLYGLVSVLRSETGWAFLAIQEDVTAAEAIGVNTQKYRLLSFTLSGAICGLAGGIFAPATGYISPTMFNLQTTIDIILAGVAGGITLPVGSLLGSAIVIFVPEYLRFISEFRFVLYGLFLILLLIFLPDGVGGWVKRRLD